MGCCQSLENLNDSNVKLFSFEGKKIKAKIVRVYDGDTCWAVFYHNKEPIKMKIRMHGYDAPELKPPLNMPFRDIEIEKAILSKCQLEYLVLNKIVTLDCFGWDKYGRLLANIIVNNINIMEYMIKNKYGIPYNGGSKHTYVC
jgi:endonuclease YncB( thermonuclease family)